MIVYYKHTRSILFLSFHSLVFDSNLFSFIDSILLFSLPLLVSRFVLLWYFLQPKFDSSNEFAGVCRVVMTVDANELDITGLQRLVAPEN